MKQKLPSSILTWWSIWPAEDKDFSVTIHNCNRKLLSPKSPYYACIQETVMMDMNRKIGIYHGIKSVIYYVFPRGGNIKEHQEFWFWQRFGIYVRKKEAVSRKKKKKRSLNHLTIVLRILVEKNWKQIRPFLLSPNMFTITTAHMCDVLVEKYVFKGTMTIINIGLNMYVLGGEFLYWLW